MQIKYENGIKWVSCDYLGEIIGEFKKFRAAQIADGQKRKWEDYFFLRLAYEITDDLRVKEEIKSVIIYQEGGVDLSLNLAPFGLKKEHWSLYAEKLKKILKEIWETGEAKDYQGLDLNWPGGFYYCDQCKKVIRDRELAWFSERDKNLDFCSETCHSKFEEHNTPKEENKEPEKQLKNQTEKIIWIAISIVMVSVFALYLLFNWLKNKKLKKH